MASIARLVRQICLLREQGDAGRAAQLQENDLTAAVRNLRATHGAEILPEPGLQALFAAERQRVAEAVLLAELLIPQLLGSRPVPRPAAAITAVTPRPAAPRPPDAGPPAITDLLDAMLAAERAGRRPSPLSTRES